MNRETFIISAVIALYGAIVIGKISGQEAQDIAYSATKSVALSQTNLETINTIAAYTYGMSCHYITTSEAYQAKNIKEIIHAANKNRNCFRESARMAGLEK